MYLRYLSSQDINFCGTKTTLSNKSGTVCRYGDNQSVLVHHTKYRLLLQQSGIYIETVKVSRWYMELQVQNKKTKLTGEQDASRHANHIIVFKQSSLTLYKSCKLRFALNRACI